MIKNKEIREKDVENDIKEWIKKKGIYCVKCHSGSIIAVSKKTGRKYRMQLEEQGTPDLFCGANGYFIAIEVKKNKHKVDRWKRLQKRHNKGEYLPISYKTEKSQIECSEEIKRANNKYLICSSVEEVKCFFEKIGVL